jgi:hypothetical protein
MRLPGRLGFAAALASGALAAASLASAGQSAHGSATAGPFATGIIPAGTAFDGTRMWVIASPNPGVIELSPAVTAAGPFPADGIDIWVSGFNDMTGLNPDGTTARPSATRVIPPGTAFDGTRMWVIASPNPGVIELSPAVTAASPWADGATPRIAFADTHTMALTLPT